MLVKYLLKFLGLEFLVSHSFAYACTLKNTYGVKFYYIHSLFYPQDIQWTPDWLVQGSIYWWFPVYSSLNQSIQIAYRTWKFQHDFTNQTIIPQTNIHPANRVLEHQKMIDSQAHTVRFGDDKDVFADQRNVKPLILLMKYMKSNFLWVNSRFSPVKSLFFAARSRRRISSPWPRMPWKPSSRLLRRSPWGICAKMVVFWMGHSIVDTIFNGASIHFLKWNFIMVDFLETIFPLFKIQGFVENGWLLWDNQVFCFFTGTMVDWFYGKTLDNIF